MLTFRVDAADAAAAQEWAGRLGLDRSELLRTALRRHVDRLRSENDAEAWARHPLSAEESALAEVSGWGPAEEWSDWNEDAHAAR